MNPDRADAELFEVARRVDAVCVQFEKSWRTGRSPRLEEYLERLPAPEQPALFGELLRLEIELRVGQGDKPTPEDLYHRFPGEKSWIDSILAEVAETFPPAPVSLDTPANQPDDPPARIGRYRLRNLLGAGAFGRVYLAIDEDLHREVAIKVSHPARSIAPARHANGESDGTADHDSVLAEARVLAGLDHPAIVPVFDMGRLPDGRLFIVTKLIKGSNLARRLLDGPPTPTEAAGWVATVAEALQSAHEQGLVHRDVKPSNILIDAAERVYVTDFGLALREEDFGKGPQFLGTPAYMSPEQARGEGHRVDARSDVFSLGVVLYEMLTGRRPFRGDSRHEVLEQILALEPRPPRQLNRTIPRELERICLRALAKRATDRFDTALDLAEDLQRFLGAIAPSAASPVALQVAVAASDPDTLSRSRGALPRIVPRGLRSFEAEDADFYLRLLPGPRDREGLPRSVQFWKRSIESLGEDAFTVGLLYGPSGCGKSSLVHAGLLPRLAGNVEWILVEAAAGDTEARLQRALRRRFPALMTAATLPEMAALLRRGGVLAPGQKILLVLDQFEQWLHTPGDNGDGELVRTLRQCDGGHFQCLLLVRDDFWLAANRFMQELEVPIVENRNCALVDLFDPRHARRVLAEFGQAYGALPEAPADWSREHEAFLDRAVAALAQDNKVICVQLAVFAEMMKDKTWIPSTLEQAGGFEGIGEAFLEEAFESRSAPAECRLHQNAARAVLQALLPEQGTEIKGNSRTSAQLCQASGYANRPRDFLVLVNLLDSRLHLIAPAELPDDSPPDAGADRRYQLTHDYLVPSLRSWLTRKQRETRRGRAELCLAERAAWWKAQPRPSHLPNAREWLTIRLRTSRHRWTEWETRMMRRAGRRYTGRAVVFVAVLGLLAGGVFEASAYLRAVRLVDQLAGAPTREVPDLIRQFEGCRRWADPRLAEIADNDATSVPYRIHANLALLPSEPGRLDFLSDQLLRADLETFLPLREALDPYRSRLVEPLWAVALDPTRPDKERLRAGCALAVFAPPVGDPDRWRGLATAMPRQLLAAVIEAPAQFGAVVEAARPARAVLIEPLAASFRDTERSEAELTMTTELLLDLARDRADVLAEMLLHADAKRFARVFVVAADRVQGVAPILEREVRLLEATPVPPVAVFTTEEEELKDRSAAAQANAAIALLRMGRGESVWPLLRHRSDPRVRTYLLHRLRAYGVAPEIIAARLEVETDTSARRALLLALGETTLPTAERERLRTRILPLFRDHPDPGIHSAAEWVLRKWGIEDTPPRGTLNPAGRQNPSPGRAETPRWYVNAESHTMVVLPGPLDFWMEKPQAKPGNDTRWIKTRIARSFAIATKEVTTAQYSRFLGQPAGAEVALAYGRVSWYDAARYCNWLSKEEGLPQSQWCYVPVKSDLGEMLLEPAPDCLARTGYRLPTEAEWDYACRAGSCTPRYYGHAVELLARYAWYIQNSGERRHPPGLLMPNDFGLFDTYGNVWEWCHDLQAAPATKATGEAVQFVARGGTYTARPWFLLSSWTSSEFARGTSELIGFRIARTLAATGPATGQRGAPDGSVAPLRGGSLYYGPRRNQSSFRVESIAIDRGAGGPPGFRVARTER